MVTLYVYLAEEAQSEIVGMNKDANSDAFRVKILKNHDFLRKRLLRNILNKMLKQTFYIKVQSDNVV